MSLEAIEGLGERLKRFWRYYGQWTRTRTRDTSRYGLAYVSGLLRLEAPTEYGTYWSPNGSE